MSAAAMTAVMLFLDPGRLRHPTGVAALRVMQGSHLSGLRKPDRFDVAHLDQWRELSHPVLVRRVCDLHDATGATLGVDATGAGRPLVDSLRAQGRRVVAVTWTGGDAATVRRVRGGYECRVAKAELMRQLVAAVHTGSLRVASALPLAEDFLRELADAEVHVAPSGRERFEIEGEGHHGDMAGAVAMALWWASRPVRRAGWVPSPVKPRV